MATLPEYKRPPGPPDFEATVFAIATGDGGRKHPFVSGYRACHDLGLGELNDAQHEYPDGPVAPGSSGRALLWLLAPERQAGRLLVGLEFTVQEGRRHVGRGRITRILNADLERPG